MLDHLILFGAHCNLWKDIIPENWLNYLIMTALDILFPICSLLNITVISVERLHATFWPFRHRVIKKWTYGLIIAAIWVTSVFLSVGVASFRYFKYAMQNDKYFYLWCSFNSICLLVICISYACIITKVRCGTQPQHHGTASRERKLTMTLLIVTFVSLLLWLPFVLSSFLYFIIDAFRSFSEEEHLHYVFAMMFLYHGNSLVNPILYTLKMPEYRRALLTLCFKRPRHQRQVQAFPLRVI